MIKKNSKKITKTDIIILFITPLFFGIGVLIYNMNVKDYYAKAVKIKKKDSLSLNVNFIRFNRGTIHFNNKYYVHNYKNSYKEMIDIWEMNTPCFLLKMANNDSILLMTENELKYVILDSNRDTTKTIGDMSIPEFYRKYIKKTKKK